MSRQNALVLLFHCLFWLIYIGFLTMVIQGYILDFGEALHATFYSFCSHAFLVYVHLLILLPLFFDRQKYIAYGFGLMALLLAFGYLRVEVLWSMAVQQMPWLTETLQPDLKVAIVVGGFFVLLLSVPLRLIKNALKKEILERDLKQQQLEAELRFLKAQVNPHFLFNALNNIYALSFTESKQAPEMILKLSEMMSYMLYECKGEKVLLQSEVQYLKNYIALQQLKKEGEQQIEFVTEGNWKDLWISPLLFIPLFENVFKHGNLDNTREGWLKSKLWVEEEQLRFSIVNTKGQAVLHSHPHRGGVGLHNLKERLQLLYPDSHTLQIDNQSDLFTVQLHIHCQMLQAPEDEKIKLPHRR